MKFYSTQKKYLSLLVVASWFTCGLQPTFAASTFSGNSSVTLTIDSITSSNGITSGLSIDGLFDVGNTTTAPGFGNYTTGDGQSTFSYNGASLPTTVSAGNSINQLFSAQGGAGNGSVDSYYQAYGAFNFANNSLGGIITVSFSLDYNLNAAASGQASQADVSIDYYDDLGLINAGFDQAIANAQTNINAVAGSGVPLLFNMVLNPGDFNTFYTDVAITGTASASPVPLPTALWMFLSGLIGLRSFKAKQGTS